MSQRVKKPGRLEDNQGKRRRRRPSGSDGEEDGTRSGSNSGGNSSFPSIGGMWTPRHLNDLKVSSIYNRNSAEAPAELYRKDLISAMKLADSEPLTPEEYWLITDPWKQEWEKGVQVPVNPESLPEPEVVVISPVNERSHDFRLPKKKYIRVTHDDFFNPDYHQLVSTAARAEKVCSYDLDDIDASWLSCANADRGMQTLPVISEFLMEQVIEELELQCWEQVQTILKSQEGLGIEYDENVICDVCRSPESEEGNEMVFCDACNICVHQACYGITTIPSGSWLCRTCTLGIRPSCVLCPNMGGAMKATRSGQKWAHVACAIWIPEVSIGSVEKMEPITKISAIPQSRWSLVCVLCKDKVGACIQCSVKTCKTAYHVTCAFKNGLEMKPIIVDENAEDGIKLRSYCQKHSVNPKKEKSTNSGSEEDGEKKKARAMTAEERNQARAEKLQQIESEFYKYVRLKDVSQNLAVDMDIVMLVYNYWKLKRKALNNRPLVPPRPETTQLLTQQQEQDLEQMKMFVQLRQDLERVRNLCYMVSRREKLSRTYFRLREQTFQKQVAILSDKAMDLGSLGSQERCAILDANHGPSIYDQIYSQNGAEGSLKDYGTLVSLIAGEDKKNKVINGVIKPKKSSATAANDTFTSGSSSFKRQFVNGARRKNLMGESCSSLSESEVSDNVVASTRKLKLSHSNSGRKPLSYLFDSDSSADGTATSTLPSTAKGVTDKTNKAVKGKSSALRQAQKFGKKSSTSDSDEIELPVPKTTGGNIGKTDGPIYSDSDSEDSTRKQTSSPVATKASVKEFTRKSNKKDTQHGALSTVPTKTTPAPGPKGKLKGVGRKKKGGFEPTELIVPQREAAKKASESIRSVKQRKEGGVVEASPSVPDMSNPLSPSNSSRSKEREFDANENNLLEKVKEERNVSSVAQEKTKVQKQRGDKSRNLEKKGNSSKKSSKAVTPTVTKEDPDSDVRDQYEFDGSNDGSAKNVPSFVPQRQAAKKAAEHIRSGLSNVVAQRLIIEDEMEAATRKKTKGEKSSKKLIDSSSAGNSSVKKIGKIRGKSPNGDETLEEASNKEADNNTTTNVKSRAKKRSLSKGGEETKTTGKSGKKDLMSTNLLEDTNNKDTDWPFLDRGIQIQCRRSRERSSSSSSSSSSGSSSSDSSSSSRSSASSSPASASPESNAVQRKTLPINSTYPTSNLAASMSVTTPKGSSRKLKTSDRSPDSGPRNETITGKKPTPKGRGPTKLRPRRTSTSGALSTTTTDSSPHKQQLTSHELSGDEEQQSRSRKHKTSTSSSSSSSSSRCSPSPSSGNRNSKTNNKSTKTKGKRGTRESSEFREAEKNLISATELDQASISSKSCLKSQTRTKTKALVSSSRSVSGILDLSSDSENDTNKVPTGTSPRGGSVVKDKTKELPSQSPSIAPSDSKLKSSTSKTKKKGVSNLSDSENELADEKENSCLTPETSTLEASSTNSKNKAQKSSVSSSAISILSPLTPSSENKEKEQSSSSSNNNNFPRSSDTEPEMKRARLDSGTSGSQAHLLPLHPPGGPMCGSSMHSGTSICGSLNAKSLFSPSRVGHENDLVDFDSELYDLARSVSADYSQCDEDGVGGNSTLPFSFSNNFLLREDNGEDSAQATMNLVEKLRLQHARKSGCPRSSMDGSDLSLPEDGSKSPISSARSSYEKKSDGPLQSNNSMIEAPSIITGDEIVFDESSKMMGIIPSPDRDKSIQGDERWVPPSSSEQTVPQTSSLSELELGLNFHQKQQQHLHNPQLLSSNNSNNNNSSSSLQVSTPLCSPTSHGMMHKQHESNLSLDSKFMPLSIRRLTSSGENEEMEKEEIKRHSDRKNSNEVKKSLDSQYNMTSVSCASAPSPSSLLSPGSKLPHGVQSMLFNSSGSTPPPGSAGYPNTSSSHAPFLYPIAGTPSIANMVTSLTSPVTSSVGSVTSAHNSFFRNQQSPVANVSTGVSQHTATSSLSSPAGYPRQNFQQSSQQQQHFMHSKQSQEHNQQMQNNSKDNTVVSPSISPNVVNKRRASEFIEEKNISESLASVVTSGMPPLAKPSIASPSMILAANNVKNHTPPPPPQSTVAQIIENVVNNHANTNNNNLSAAQEILSAMLNMNPQTISSSLSCNENTETSQQEKQLVSNLLAGMSKLPSSISLHDSSSSIQPESRESISNGNQTKTSQSSFAPSSREKGTEVNSKFNSEPITVTTAKVSPSPRGRGRRATTPRAAAAAKNQDKILTACETNGIKGKGRGERKSTSSTSPARAAKAATPRARGGGRGKGKGKGMVATRKDLAGTVYDIDFDEFEENVDEKLDLRMLRERRKSSDVHFENKLCKSENSQSPSDQRLVSLEISSPRIARDFDGSRNVGCNQKASSNNQPHSSSSSSSAITANESIAPILQPPLPGPVDMRTYSLGSTTSSITERHTDDNNKTGKSDFMSRRESKVGEISSLLFSSGSGKGSIRNEFEELDETLEALTSASKLSSYSSVSRSSNSHSSNQQLGNLDVTGVNYQVTSANSQQNLISGKDSIITDNSVEPDMKTNTDLSRNQLKVKIKGPFLDASYGSHSIVGDPSSGDPSQHYPNSFHLPSGPSQVVSVPTNNTSNLRRMRKKELLRQYWTQDMNMDGPTHEADGGTVSSMVHPINRSVITIPKAVASMAIIPTKDDYRLESMSNNDMFSGNNFGMGKDALGGGTGTEKRKRNKGMREMAALGIITCDTPRERRRDRMDPNLSTSNYSAEMMGKKRGKANKRPIRSTFIPPTLVDSEANNDKKVGGLKSLLIPPSASANAISTVVTAVNHPTPKLKIKFGDLSKVNTGSIQANAVGQNHVLSDSSDKEAPNKKAKGRPPKKRGISELVSAAPPTMEELKRESMKFRELVMQDFAVEERKEILQLQGTRRHKKHKRKGGAVSSETDDGTKPNPEVKVIADGTTKLILRFGKSRMEVGAGGTEGSSSTVGGGNTTANKLNPTAAGGSGLGTEATTDDVMSGENDSGFTGSSEGSSGSVSELTGASKERLSSSLSSSKVTPAVTLSVPLIKTEPNSTVPPTDNSSVPVSCATSSSSSSSVLVPPVVPSNLTFPDIPNNNVTLPPGGGDIKPPNISEPNNFTKKNDKIMPIRLKLSRCYEGYALKKKQDSCAGDGVPPPSTPKQSDSCEVR